MSARSAEHLSIDPAGECDVAVVGAGIVGLAVARELLARHPRLRVTVLEREPQIARHQTGHSSGVIHAGIYYKPGSLKARLCVEGSRRLYEYCEASGIETKVCGKVIVAASPDELPRLDELERRGRANGVDGLRRVGQAGLAELEPHARGVSALHSPRTGVVDFVSVAHALAVDVRIAGGIVATGCEVTDVHRRMRAIALGHSKGETRASYAVFCAGAWSDRLATEAGGPAEPRIVPFRGTYLRLRRERAHLVRALIYPVPDPGLPFLGVHLTRSASGDVLVGPTAVLAATRDHNRRLPSGRDALATASWPGSWRMARRWWRTGVAEIRRAASREAVAADAARYVPEIAPDDLRPGFAGVRAQAVARDGTLLDDFIVFEAERELHVRNAPSPAATSCLALAGLIAERVERATR